MNAFGKILICLTVCVLVNCDPREDQKALIAKLIPVYEALSEADIKTKADANIKVLDSLFKDVTDTYTKADFKPLATFYGEMSKFLDQSIVAAWPVLDKLEETSRKRDYVGLGITVEVGIWTEQEYKKYQAKPINVTGTEDVLLVKLADLEDKLFTMLENYVDTFKKEKETAFWADFLSGVKAFLTEGLTTFHIEVKKETTADKRLKLYQVMLDDLTDVYNKEKP